MNRRTVRSGLILLALALPLTFAAQARAGDFESQFTQGNNGFFASPPCPVRQFPTFESIVPVPRIVDPFAQDLIPVFCTVQVKKDGNPVKKAKGKFSSELLVLDNNTGMGESFPIRRGRFRTDNNGSDSFDFDLPSELFADGFESGDVSAWSYTRTDFTNRKNATQTSVSCSTSKSSSSD